MAASVRIPHLEEPGDREEGRLRSKAAATDANLRSALSALANPEAEFIETGSTDLFRACDAVARRVGIALQPADSSQSVEAIARTSSVRVRKISLRGTWWKRDAGPLLSYRDGLPVALIPHANGRYFLFDPALGTKETVDESTAAQIGPAAYTFYAPLPSGAVTPLELAKFSLHGSHGDVLRVLTCSGAAGALGLVAPLLTAWFAGSIIHSGDRGQLPILVAAMIVSAVCSAMFNLTAAFALQRAGARASARVMAGLWDRALALPTSFFRQFNAADLAMRLLSVDRARESLAGTLGLGAASCLFGALQIALLFRFSPALAAPAIAIVAAVAGASILAGRLTHSRQAAIAAYEARTAGKTLESLQGVAKLRVAGAETRAFVSWARSFAAGRRESIRARRIAAALAALHAAAPLTGWILIAALAGGDAALRGNPAYLLAFGATFQQLLAAALQLSGFLMAWAQVTALVDRTKPLLAAEPESSPEGIDPGCLRGAIELRDVTFRYTPSEPAALSGVSLRIEPGEFVALVGSSGSGKSTLLRLLLGFERPEAGSVLYDGRDLATFDLPSVRRQLGVATQGARILAGDIASNILGATGLGMDAAWNAAEAAGIASDIRDMPMGMRTQLSEDGAGLSGGQRQRILIARALAHSPRILLMDEATSALDNRTQSAVTAEIERLGVTRVVVAHRLSAVRRADRIYVLEAGRIVESGSYDELMTLRGRFFALAARQRA